VKTGEVKSPPAYEDIATFPIRLVEGRVQVKSEN
jgi:3-phenylpropionate/trans-cinnamate dioxygenase ferredoxin component